jgi:hypothetical protein
LPPKGDAWNVPRSGIDGKIMNIFPLLGRSLKSDEVIEFLELWDAEVVYDFDREHENVPDAYHTAAKAAGVEMLFDATQALTTVFLRINATDDFAAFDLSQSDIPSFDTIEDAKRFAAKKGLSATRGHAIFLERSRDWIKLGFATHTVHYEFVGGVLDMVTVALRQPDS